MTEEDTYKFGIGDLVKPNGKASLRNKIFTKDRRFVITGVDYNFAFDEDHWYQLAAKDDKSALYCLKEDEMDLVRKFEWVF